MASIFPRLNKGGTTTWRVMIRRKGIKQFISSFASYDDAVKFCEENEEKYVFSPETFSFDALKNKRELEFFRRNKSRLQNDID